jgi:hypothetical protein
MTPKEGVDFYDRLHSESNVPQTPAFCSLNSERVRYGHIDRDTVGRTREGCLSAFSGYALRS